MNDRPGGAHRVGSVPLADAGEAFRTACDRLGSHLARLRDGETGSRANWIAGHAVDRARRRRALRACLSCLILGAALSAPSPAQEYPAKPVRLIVPFPGGTTDILARAFAARAALGQPVVVENVPGASGAIGLGRAARSAPDGYTLSIGATATFAVSPHFNPNLPYDPLRDFAPIALLGRLPIVLVVNANVPAGSVGELVGLAKQRPGELNYATVSPGSTGHLLGEMFRRAAGIEIVHVPYKGGGPAMAGLLGGEVQLYFASLVEAIPHVRSGKLRALGVADARRAPAIPSVPTLPEVGYALEAPVWFGLVAPAGTPRPIVDRLAAEVERINALEETRKVLDGQGAEPGDLGPGAFGALIAAEYAKFGRVIRETGIKAE